MTDALTPPATDGIILTDAAAAKVKSLLDQEGRDDLALRLAVQPGGCSGLRYQLFFDERHLEGDVVKTYGGVDVVTDRMSAPYLAGATIDFMDTIEKQGFTIDNPNATSTCACGDSFHGAGAEALELFPRWIVGVITAFRPCYWADEAPYFRYCSM